jgi:hypothetical protein
MTDGAQATRHPLRIEIPSVIRFIKDRGRGSLARLRQPPAYDRKCQTRPRSRRRSVTLIFYAVLMPQRVDILQRHHLRLLEIVRTALSCLTSSVQEADVVALRHLRAEMVSALAAYQRFVHEEVYMPAILCGDADAQMDAYSIKVGCIEVQNDYEVFRQRWVHRNVAGSWAEYRLSTIRMMKQLRNHVQHATQLQERWDGTRASERTRSKPRAVA